MNCPRCGEAFEEGCRCHSQVGSAAPPHEAGLGDDPFGAGAPGHESSEDDRAWRDELSDRLNRYRARRQMRPPRYPSLNLPFERAPLPSAECARPLPPIAESSLALDPAGRIPVQDEKGCVEAALPGEASRQLPSQARGVSAKIIEFPRFAWAPPLPPSDQLAEPIIDRPRILEVPEVAPPPPALGGITIEPAEPQEAEKRPGIDFPLQTGSLTRRVFAALIDGLVVGVAGAMFGFVFWKVANVFPPGPQLVSLGLGVPVVFWSVYQYLLIVYSGRTFGLMAAGLELTRFDGSHPSRSVRRWRILASYLSAASLGMGYFWVFLDEDQLCWHDRITHTYLAPKKKCSHSQGNSPRSASGKNDLTPPESGRAGSDTAGCAPLTQG
jgi:hypothetical protein